MQKVGWLSGRLCSVTRVLAQAGDAKLGPQSLVGLSWVYHLTKSNHAKCSTDHMIPTCVT